MEVLPWRPSQSEGTGVGGIQGRLGGVQTEPMVVGDPQVCTTNPQLLFYSHPSTQSQMGWLKMA